MELLLAEKEKLLLDVKKFNDVEGRHLVEEGFFLLPVEEGKTPCSYCNSMIHSGQTCPVKHTRDFGVNPKNEYGVMQDCEQCGSYNHMIQACVHSEANGKNRQGVDGKKNQCSQCNSFDHVLGLCNEKDIERNGRNKQDPITGRKFRCDECGSYDHMTKVCSHSAFKLVAGRKVRRMGRCLYCGSRGHIGELDCMKIS